MEDADKDVSAVAERAVRLFFDFADQLADVLAAGHEHERAASRGGTEQRRRELVGEALAGHDTDERALGYAMKGDHIGMVGWGERAAAALRTLAASLGGQALVVSVADDLAWAWVRGRWRRHDWRRSLADAAIPAASVAVGAPAAGVGGFRQTHDEARAAARVAARRPRPLTFYDDVALEALATSDEQLASAFATRELGSLAAGDARAARLRRTLRVYLSRCGQNAASTAAALGVHDQTVRYQLRSIEERLGRAITQRPAELAAALRLHALFEESGAPLAQTR
jgi:DNA-binding PucR family transcriptional regulator